MGVYVVRRLGWLALVLLVMSLISFSLVRVVPADPAAYLAGMGATNDQIESIRREMGLDRPLPVQYIAFMKGALRLDFGRSIRTRQPVADDLKIYFPATLELIAVSFTVYVVVGLGLGIWAGWKKGGVGDVLIRFFAMVGSAVPNFWLGIVLQLIFFARLGWLPVGDRADVTLLPPPFVTGSYFIDSLLSQDWVLFFSLLKHMVLPGTTLVLALLATGVRQMRASVISESGQQYVRTARAKGVPTWLVLLKHVVKNALLPVVTMFGVQLGYLFSWIFLIEVIFQWPGIGLYAFQSFQAFDYSPIMALTLLITFLFVIINLITDLIYARIDPRIKY